ncbi:cobalamin B12-binding domain-containing protein [Rhodococcus sp. IEGM 1330]|uniref:cobalamin B12-binding domain-containing protein n=1 Tax=Rhodococcus sp. IEGM 1330 TaxID=3082225 RepID=UPI002952D88F|nr:cobalamin B12-binding domain-containing protein [Rhodococcus sp. IEGM 1330]MDV8022647.1 cobalamin B12-binding domain-containing protein [Rhodococcus sp. IEGM 1330]
MTELERDLVAGVTTTHPVSRRVLIVTTPSDVHSWNLVFLSLVVRDAGMSCRIVGPASQLDEIVVGAEEFAPDVVLVSTINGHGEFEAADVLNALREVCDPHVPVLIGGILGVSHELRSSRRSALLSMGYTEVFEGADLTVGKVRSELERAGLAHLASAGGGR